ncbi:hypothetical protein SteCoe_35540 [Stentor coeruleus]|uniref:Tetratricopeptide repeat protein 29 n=1 Tax=Stentor coeruleus TaxID=5963 RepID=A0A1R2AS62_9CILI|nr:hypothetical protein SteCoe_35540 [Stentor coeruleus]
MHFRSLVMSFGRFSRSFSILTRIQEFQQQSGNNAFASLNYAVDQIQESLKAKDVNEVSIAAKHILKLTNEINKKEEIKTAELLTILGVNLANFEDSLSAGDCLLRAFELYNKNYSTHADLAFESSVRASSIFLGSNDPIKAQEILEVLLPKAKDLPNPKVKGVFFHQLGLVKVLIQDLPTSIKYLETANYLLTNIKDDPSLAEPVISNFRLLSHVYKTKGDINKAKDHLLGALYMILQKTEIDLVDVLNIQMELAGIYIALGMEKELFQSIEHVKTLCIESNIENKHKMVDNMYANLISALLQSRSTETTTQLLEDRIKYAETHLANEYRGLYESYRRLTDCYTEKNNSKNAIISAFNALEYAEKLDDVKEIIHSCNILADLYSKVGDFSIAEEYFNRVTELLKKNPNEFLQNIHYSNLSVVYTKLGEFEKALINARKYLESLLAAKKQDLNAIFTVNIRISHLLSLSKNFEEALKYINNAESAAIKLHGDKSKLYADCLECYGNYYVETGNYDQALNYLNRALELKNVLYGKKSIESRPIYDNILAAYYLTRNWSKVIEIAQYRAELLRENKLFSDTYEASTYFSYGEAYNGLNNLHAAKENYNKAKELYKKIGISENVDVIEEKLKLLKV